VSAEWQHHWRLRTYRTNTPHVQRIPKTLEYLRIYALEIAYVHLPKQSETPKAFSQKVYRTLRTTAVVDNRPRDVRVTLLYPTTDWAMVWTNLHGTWASNGIKANWYTVIHDILPTNERLHTTRMTRPSVQRAGSETPACSY
jgi:hypothetical protein